MITDFQLLEILTRHDVPLVVIGGHAVVFHGWVRATEDLDIVWLRSPLAETTTTSSQCCVALRRLLGRAGATPPRTWTSHRSTLLESTTCSVCPMELQCTLHR